MNERIQELARQAGAQHRLNLGVEEFCFEHHELKKFAKLIVQECADVCESFGESGDGYTCSAEILEHFGVKYGSIDG